MKLSAFPKCYIDQIAGDRSMSVFDWITMARSLDADGLEMYDGFFTSLEPGYLDEVGAALASAGLGADASISVTERGVVVQMLADKAYFANDSAALGTVGDAIVDVIAGVLRPVPNAVEVQGYTDDVPITGGPFTSNWELSAVRAVNVVQRLEEIGGITKNRLSAIGYGTTHPVAPNTTAAGQAENRRIDVVVLTVALSASGAAAAAQGSS
jgi:chemotaxis protein MotB